MKKIKAFCRDIRKRLDSYVAVPLSEMFELLELIVNHLEKSKTDMLVGDLKDTLIKPQQYRIGNYFRINGTLNCVEKIETTKINGIDFKYTNPALVNHAILEDLGFEAKAMGRYELISKEKGILYHSTEEDISIMDGKYFRYCEIYKDVKYVHQLQNIYFDLMQSELKFS